MSLVNGIRRIESLISGTTSSAQLQTALATPTDNASFIQAMNISAQARLLIDSPTALPIILGSALGLSAMAASATMLAAVTADPVASSTVYANKETQRSIVLSSTSSHYRWAKYFRWPTAAVSALGSTGTSRIFFAGGVYIATINVGGLLSSSDGFTWTNRGLPFSSIQQAIAHNGTNLFMVGSYTTGGIATSPDGATWTARTTPGTTRVNSVGFIGSTWTILGIFNDGYSDLPRSYTSADNGTTWTSRSGPWVTAGVATGTYWRCNDRLIGVGPVFASDGYTQSGFSTTDGVNWSALALPQINSTNYASSSATFGNGLYVITSGSTAAVWTSTTGLQGSWVARTAPTTLNNITFTAGLFFASSGTSIYYSLDAITWSVYTGSTSIAALGSGNGLVIAGTSTRSLITSLG